MRISVGRHPIPAPPPCSPSDRQEEIWSSFTGCHGPELSIGSTFYARQQFCGCTTTRSSRVVVGMGSIHGTTSRRHLRDSPLRPTRRSAASRRQHGRPAVAVRPTKTSPPERPLDDDRLGSASGDAVHRTLTLCQKRGQTVPFADGGCGHPETHLPDPAAMPPAPSMALIFDNPAGVRGRKLRAPERRASFVNNAGSTQLVLSENSEDPPISNPTPVKSPRSLTGC